MKKETKKIDARRKICTFDFIDISGHFTGGYVELL